MPHFQPLQTHPDGSERRVGVEIEFAGLDLGVACDVVQRVLGGHVTGTDPHCKTVEKTKIGAVHVELDTALRASNDMPPVRFGLDLAESVIPLEIVTEPLSQKDLTLLNKLIGALRDRGGKGSRTGVLRGFGVHLNVALRAGDFDHALRILQAYGLLEAHLRNVEALDLTRRALPFVQPWPNGFVTALLQDEITDWTDLAERVGDHISTRNHGLDLLPLLKDAAPQTFAQHFPNNKTAARPAYHFRLPDCRLDEAGWSLAQPWALWGLVEAVAINDAAHRALSQAWQAHQEQRILTNNWANTSAYILSEVELERA